VNAKWRQDLDKRSSDCAETRRALEGGGAVRTGSVALGRNSPVWRRRPFGLGSGGDYRASLASLMFLNGRHHGNKASRAALGPLRDTTFNGEIGHDKSRRVSPTRQTG
jgi:hypothetical protein